MSFLKKSVSVLAVFAVIPAAVAVTARPSVTNIANAASRRLPTLTAYVNGTTTTTTSTSSTMSDTECVEAYTECMKADDVCGPEFEECTTRKLFHGKMPMCLNVLSQCSSAGVADLFGTSAITSLGNIKTQDSTTGEILDYTYPTDGSAMGQWISAAAINNQYDTSTCVKRYSSCLNKDSVCGADFELCTTAKEFRKQALFCDSTLARCQSAGVRELFGVYPWTPSSATIGGRVATMIEDGAQLAAMNAVSTCYKVVEQCFLGACTANPLRCIEGSTLETVTAANLASETPENTTPVSSSGDAISKSDVNRYLKTACLDTIGANKYCHMTFREKTPTKGELSDVDVQEEVFEAAIDQRKKYVDSKIQDVMQKFDTRAKDKCAQTIRTCAMRSCGEGIGSVCYTSVFSASGQNSINGAKTHDEIKRSCESIVNTDTNCQYAYASIKNEAYSYAYLNDNVFDTLFPVYDEMQKADPIGVVASLNATLSNNYSMAAIAEMKKQCQSVATSCVKAMCGTDYVNCYRNRTDIVGNLTQSGDSDFDKSMNKVGGVLDYTIVLGLCMNTVKNADVCDEHLKITSARLKQDETNSSWADSSSVRDGWIDAGGAKVIDKKNSTKEDVKKIIDGNEMCTNSKGIEGICYEVDADGDVYDEPVMQSYQTYLTTQAANTLFRELITDIEYEAQAKYNAKLTKQQNMCMSANSGGVMGKNDLGSTFMWAKLKNNKVPDNYATAGLRPNQFTASNELYGSFCRVRVNVQSDHKDIQDAINKGADWATAYFAAGDSFTCGSWIGGKDLEKIAEIVGKDARDDAEKAQVKNLEWWLAPLGAAATGIGGAYLGAGIQNGDIFGKLSGLNSNKKNTDSFETNQKNCENATDKATTLLGSADNKDSGTIETRVNVAINSAKKLDVESSATSNVETYLGAYKTAVTAYKNAKTTQEKEAAAAAAAAANQQLKDSLYALQGACKELDEDDVDDDDAKKTKIAAGVTGAVTAIAGGALTFHAVKAIRDQKLTDAELEAYNKFMDEIGDHIYCYIGGEEAGSYGDVITTSME